MSETTIKYTYPKLKEFDGKTIQIEGFFEPQYQKWNPTLKTMERREDTTVKLTPKEKEDGWRWRVSMILSGKKVISLSYLQLKSLCKSCGVDDKNYEGLIGMSVIVMWNKLDGLESSYYFTPDGSTTQSSGLTQKEENEINV